MDQKSGSLWEWVIPMACFFCFAWVVWQLPAFLLDLIPYESESLQAQVTAIFLKSDAFPGLAGLFGGNADIVDWAALIAIPILFVLGVMTVRRASIEIEDWRPIDRISIFLGRMTMMMIVCLTCVMLYEVFVRYVLERPTLWANETTQWIASFVFLMAGLYAMQQRSHIRIVLLYDKAPRWMRKTFDTISTVLIVIFTFAMIYGSYKQVFINKLYRWELNDSAFNPPIPATLQPMVLIVMTLVAAQAVINLFADWNKEEGEHAVVEIDEDEIAALKKSLGTN